ncbi:hypothetical protein V6N11_030759 [Hibiscus sabdariffa]|uniref:Uncharacterized protein n=1 Tax=Hibiscus sabdariffa TaxID=183260 RepID=A0ABR2NBM7_9ROSI
MDDSVANVKKLNISKKFLSEEPKKREENKLSDMAWSAVSSAVTTIGKLLGEETVYLWGEKEQVDRLQTELKWMRSSLMEADVKQHEDERIRLWVAEIRELAYDAEDVIEDFALRVGSKRKGGFLGCLKRSACILIEGWELHGTRSKIEKIIGRILDLVRRLQVYGIKGLKDGEGSSLSVRRELRRPYPHIIDQNIVGLNNALEELVPKLVEEGSHTHCRVVSIWGMGEAWDRLKPAFPVARDIHSHSRILLTTRNEEIVSHADRSGYPYKLPFLNDEESWELFQKIAFPLSHSTDDRVDEKRKLEKDMTKHCAGLPLAILVLGGILATKISLDEWKRVSENVKSYMNRSIGQGTMQVLALSYDDLPAYLRPCFLYLSHYPEDYVIYAERLIQLWVAEGIVSSKEEGDEEWEVAEDVAEHYLMELAARCMIQVRDRDPATLKIKTFQLHDEMRFLCLSKAKQDNFLFTVDESNASSSATIRKIRRISALKCFETQRIECPNLRSLSFFNTTRSLKELFEVGTPSACEIGPFSRLSCFWDILLAAYISFLKARGFWVYIFTNLRLLRVLNYEGPYEDAECNLIDDIGNLIHLRLLGLRRLRFKGWKLPPSLGNLRCLQTLDLRVDAYYNIQVPDVIWRMEQLRHLYLPPPFKCTRKTKLKLGTLRNLLTLVNFNTKNCYLKDLIDMTNLRMLDICGPFKIQGFNEKKLDENPPIIQAKYLHTLSIRSLGQEIDPRHLDHLLSNCSSICKLSLVHIKISKLPELRYLSSNLAYIHLENCELLEDPMPTLEQLPNLRVLELHSDAFQEKKMFCSAQGFPKLESLSLEYLFNLEQWKVVEGAMPCLGRLEITRCSRLDMGPVRQSFNNILKEGID